MLDIKKVLCISTAHIKPDSGELLQQLATDRIPYDKEPGGIIVYEKGDYGWFLYLDHDGVADEVEHFGNQRLPADLLVCIAFADANDCNMLCLDSGASILEGILPDYSEEW